MEFVADTPENIMDMTWKEIHSLIGPSRDSMSTADKMKNLMGIYKILGFHLDQDAALAILDSSKHKQIIACAGAGKTTLQLTYAAYLKVISERAWGKKLYGNRILALVYTEANIDDIKNRHAALIYNLKRTGMEECKYLDDTIEASTIHAFCLTWLKEYSFQCGTDGAELLDEREQEDLLEDCFTLLSKNFELPDLKDMKVFKSTYQFMCNSMLPVDHKLVREVYEHEGISPDIMDKMMIAYKGRKRVKNVYDYMDMLTKVHELLKSNETVRKRIQSNYDVVMLDEGQDTNSLMLSIIELIVGDSPFMMIADEDQTIFEWNGANIENLLTFKDKFEDSKVFLLNENRRCPELVLEVGKAIIGQNKKRFRKQIFTKKKGGEVELIPYSTPRGQIEALVNRLKNMSRNELANTMIAYRNNSQSTYLVELLEENKIPFNLLSGTDIFGHNLYSHIFSILEMLAKPYDKQLQLNMFKLSEIKRSDMEDILQVGRRYRKKTFGGDIGYTMFYDIDYGKFMTKPSFVKQLDFLKQISTGISTLQMKQYMQGIWQLFHKYYWDFISSENAKRFGTDGTEELMYNRVYEFFDSDLTYKEFYRRYSNRVNDFRTIARTNGINLATLSTFHKLKGLECDHIILLYMDDSQFPSLKSVSFEEGNEEDLEKHMESENRLAYVGVTRAKEKLTMCYNVHNPSIYVKIAQKVLNERETKKNIPTLSNPLGGLSPSQSIGTRPGSILSRL